MENILLMGNGKSTFDIFTGYYFHVVTMLYTQIFSIAEFLAYIFLFYHLYSHNENMTTFNKQNLDVNQETSRKAINKRHQKNIISLVGQFGSFTMETFLLIIMILFQSEDIKNLIKHYFGLKVTDLMFVILNTTNAINTMTFILASPELRRYFMEKVFNL